MINWFVFRILRPIMRVIGWIETIFLLYYKKESYDELKKLKKEIFNHVDLARYYYDEKFKWSSDPINGLFDYESEPWVTLFKKEGDCDDFAMLTYEILKDKGYDEIYITYCWKSTFNGHAIVIMKNFKGEWYLFSNTKIYGPFNNHIDAIKTHYGDETAGYYIMR